MNNTKKQQIQELLTLTPSDFDAKMYIQLNPDLYKNGIKKVYQAKLHYVKYGKKEGRKYKIDIINKKEILNKTLNEERDIKSIYNNNIIDGFNGYSPGVTASPIINILIRNTYRPKYFQKCIKSVLSQSYNNYKIIMCYDDDNCLEYLNDYMNHEKMEIFKVSDVDKTQEYFYNLYCNELLEHVKDGWIIFLDDDDMFTNDNALLKISSIMKNEDNILLWKVKLSENIIVYPRNINKINIQDITTCGLCFHSKFKDLSKWEAQRGSDWIYFEQLFRKIYTNNKRILLNDILTKTIHNSLGQLGLKDNYCLEKLIQKFSIKQLYISDSLSHLKSRFLKKYGLKEYNSSNNECAIFFGLYKQEDLNALLNHTVNNRFIMFGGSDVQNADKIKNKNKNNIRYISISKDIQTRLEAINIYSTLIKINLVDKDLFKPISFEERNKNTKIFVYNGLYKKSDNDKIYNQKLIDEVVKLLPEQEFIYSNELNLPYEKMPELYSRCFIGLRLTENDGNANMVQELEAMEIPVVHNLSDYGLKWKTVDDIVGYIENCKKTRAVNSSIEQNLLEIKNSKSINMFNLTGLDNDKIKDINNNINVFDKIINNFKNILFICGDYPGYGGAATNCNNLQQYYKSKGLNTYGFYYNFETGEHAKYEANEDYIVTDLQEINNIQFQPDLIILKSFINYDLKKKFNCPIYYLVGGIYQNNLDKYYYDISEKEEHNKYINKAVIEQIKKSTLTFVNSNHTQKIIKESFNLTTNLFYSSFVPFKNREIEVSNNFEERKYDYGLIVSDFSRKIKNVGKSIDFLKDRICNNDTVILIGKNSSKYKDLCSEFVCIDLVDKDEMANYYKQIKYIVQDSFYESCSNVLVEGIYNGCKIYKNLLLLQPYETYELNKNNYYIISNINNIDNIDNILYNKNCLFDLFDLNVCNGYIINHQDCNSIAIFISFSENKTIKYETILEEIIMFNKCIAFQNCIFQIDELIQMYYLYGKYNISTNLLGISLFYDNYLNNKNRKYNRSLYILIMSYWYGVNNMNNYIFLINNLLLLDIFHSSDVLIISKLINGYGGVQKTSTQLLCIIDLKYNIKLLSNRLTNEKEFNYYSNQLNINIPQSIIVRINIPSRIVEYINNTDFQFIINNKLNEILTYPINKKMHIISHNSMDPINKLIIKNAAKIDTIFTINNFHKKLLILNGVTNKIMLYNNYCLFDICDELKTKKSFYYNIAYIGRISKDKNVQAIINGVNLYNTSKINKINLYIVGDGNIELYNLNNNIILTGQLTFNEITKLFCNLDYVISSSITEGKPFSIIEAQSYGIPCIHSNINGINEIILENINGFLFDIKEYDLIKMDMTFDNLNKIRNTSSSHKITEILEKAYNISIETWNIMSKNCIKYCKNKYNINICSNNNLSNFYKINNIVNTKKYKLFINFKPDSDSPYGGGNISTYYIIQYISKKYSDFEITYILENDITIYFIIDPFKCRNGNFKKYSLNDVIIHRNTINITGKIIIRVNDCDKTRLILDKNKSREFAIVNNYKHIDFFIFNSHFIKEYYIDLFKKQTIETRNNYSVIINGCDQTIFCNNDKNINDKNINDKNINDKIYIVTHHWSDNMNKGYQTYYNLWHHLQNNKNMNIEFIFIGKNVPEMFCDVPIHGPFVKDKLSIELNKNHIYITDSVYDSCPNHVIEAISCGLPILYSNVPGGAKELSILSEYKIGEMYNNFDELLEKIIIIKNNYEFYRKNIEKSLYLFNIDNSVKKYYNVFLKYSYKNDTFPLKFENSVININNNTNSGYLFLNNDKYIKLIYGENVFALNRTIYPVIKLICEDYIFSDYEFNDNDNKLNDNKLNNDNDNKLNNDKINILLCSDSNYYVGLFANLNSIIQNTFYIDKTHFNFIIQIEDENNFTYLLEKFEYKMSKTISKSIIYIDSNILDPILFKTKCYNGGGHLLNIGNLSRLLIGEFMLYDKLLYLDSDSIVQDDIIEKLLFFDLKYDFYAACANKIHANNSKQIIIKMKNLLDENYNWNNVIGCAIDMNDYAFMGAPFFTNCKKWSGIYNNIIKIVYLHNNSEIGIYKLFTMSIQNILFYKKTGNINTIFNVLQDLGSNRKKWDQIDLIDNYVLDWSGIYKPWYSNGLYRHIWLYYDIMNLSLNYGKIESSKNITEKNLIYPAEIGLYNFKKYIQDMCSIKDTAIHNILYVCDAKYLQTKMSRVRFWAIEELGKSESVNLLITGPGFSNFNNDYSLQKNILELNINFDLVIWYKPLNDNYNFDKTISLPFKTCLRYNEMWDIEWTNKEITETNSNIIICHHKNDYLHYKESHKNNSNFEFIYLSHFSNPSIFKPLNINKDIDILISGVIKEKHYPLKHRLYNLIIKNKNTILSNYNIHLHNHPTYNSENSFQNTSQIEYNKIINRSKLCVACTSKYNYRLGKYVEIPMSGSVIVGDLPFEDTEFKNFIVEVNISMSDTEILHIIINTLNNKKIMDEKRNSGLKWSNKYVPASYVENLLKATISKKIFIISDEIRDNHPEFKNQKWICDLLKQEFIQSFPYETTDNVNHSHYIWYLAPWNHKYTPVGFNREQWLLFLKTKNVIFSQHHIDIDKYNQNLLSTQFDFMSKYGTQFHAICENTKNDMKKYFDESKIISKKLWINDNIYYHIPDKEKIRAKYNFSSHAYLIGTFQKDTEGKSNLPKLSKGPDLFINIIKDMYKTNNNIEIILTGLRREYIINELDKLNIKYHYFNMIPLNEINELYNCLDLYIVASRCEGGPRSIFEAGLTKTPIISTKVGISEQLMDKISLFDSNNWLTYKYAKPSAEILYNNIKLLSGTKYMDEFKKTLFNDKFKKTLFNDKIIIPQNLSIKKTILIGTTAINRSLLHKENIPDWYNYINKLDKKLYDIHWFINIDYIEKLNESVSDTATNFKSIIKTIPVTILENDALSGNFLNACKRVSSSIETYVINNKLNIDDVIIIWLEDDWKLNPQNIPLQQLMEHYFSNLTYINLSFIRNNYIHALAPSIISYKLWRQIHLASWKNQIDNIDPEHCVGLYYKKHFGSYDDLCNITLINKYKKTDKDFYQHKMFQFENSYYTFDNENNENNENDENNENNENNFYIKNDKFIENILIKDFIKDKITFIRITNSSCIEGVNYGRNFMKNYYLEKKRIQNNNNIDFYK